ncbi:MAG: glycerol dehydrogenase [Burkholderiales bacterium]|jgi:glycerol dehydrogenase|nr:glycerol dehydrogenase [Burkholderiales bacterium]
MPVLPPATLAFGAPGRYLQGPGLIAYLHDALAGLGTRPLLLLDAALVDALGPVLRDGLGPLAAATHTATFAGECCDRAIDAAAEAGRTHRCDLVIGVGGGKAVDTAKGAAMALGVPIAIVPTIASNDSPTSRLVVVYDDAHVLVATRVMPHSPALVLVDTSVIVQAPARFLVAGIGDAVSKRFEVAQAVAAGGRNFFGGRGGETATAIARACYATLRRDAAAGLEAVRCGVPDAAFERLVEACVLGSGLGFESGGLSIAHSVLRGFSGVPSLGRSLHGEQVAVGLLVQLCAMPAPDADIDVDDLIRWYRAIGLPATLHDLGLADPVDAVADLVAQRTVATAPYIGNFECPVTAPMLADAIRTAQRRVDAVDAR